MFTDAAEVVSALPQLLHIISREGLLEGYPPPGILLLLHRVGTAAAAAAAAAAAVWYSHEASFVYRKLPVQIMGVRGGSFTVGRPLINSLK